MAAAAKELSPAFSVPQFFIRCVIFCTAVGAEDRIVVWVPRGWLFPSTVGSTMADVVKVFRFESSPRRDAPHGKDVGCNVESRIVVVVKLFGGDGFAFGHQDLVSDDSAEFLVPVR